MGPYQTHVRKSIPSLCWEAAFLWLVLLVRLEWLATMPLSVLVVMGVLRALRHEGPLPTTPSATVDEALSGEPWLVAVLDH